MSVRGVPLPGPDPDAGSPPAEERILQAAMDALARLDPSAVTIKQICSAAQVTPPSVYYHFGNKDGLVAAAVERLVAEWLAAMEAAVSREAGLDTTIEQALVAWESAIAAPARPFGVFAWATLLLADSSDPVRRALVAARDRGRAMTAEVVALHMGPGPVADATAGVLIDSVIGSAVQYELDHDRAALRARLGALGAGARVIVEAARREPGIATG